MQIVLATSPHVRHAAVLEAGFSPRASAMYTFAPVGLLSLASMLRRVSLLEPVIFDTNLAIVNGDIPLNDDFYRSAAARICAHDPDVCGFMTECDSYHHVLQVLEQVKQLKPDCRCVLGGPHASAVAAATMARCSYVDAIVIGEGERTFPDLIASYIERRPGPVAGALIRSPGGQLIDGGSRPLAPDLDSLPIPAYDLYKGTPKEEIFVEAGRGCPFQCTFCSTAPFWERRHRVKSPQRILEEIRLVQRLYGSDRIHFTHDLLTTDRRWVAELCRTLTEAGAPVRWTCSARTDTVDRDMLAVMAKAGCYAIYFGIESGSARILKYIDKRVPIEQSLAILEDCRDVGIRPNAGFIAGFPTEDRESLSDTFAAFERALAIGSKPTHLFGFCPFAASSMYKGLTDLRCDGHFVDMPITPAVDEANRALIASDRDLFGAYFRPLLDVAPTRLGGVDEFSNLVEPVTAPALKLSHLVGSMLEVFDRWTGWIERRNREGEASPYRRFYGSPLDFSEFLVQQLEELVPADDPMLQLADLTRTSLFLTARVTNSPPTTMANHRSATLPAIGTPLTLDDQIQLSSVLATKRFDFDLVPLLDTSPHQLPEPERTPTYLMWDLAEEERIRLSKIDPFLFMAIEQLQRGPQPVAALMIGWADSGQAVEYDRLINVLTEARDLHLVTRV